MVAVVTTAGYYECLMIGSYPVDEVVVAVTTAGGTEVVGRRVTPWRAGWSTTLEDLSCC